MDMSISLYRHFIEIKLKEIFVVLENFLSRMVLTESDRYLIRALREEKKMSLNQILKEFPGRHWKKSTVADFLKRLKITGSIERRPGSGRKSKVNPPEKVKAVQKLIRSTDVSTGRNFSVRKIALLSGVSRAMVTKIASVDLGIKSVKKKVSMQARLKQKELREKRLELCTNLLNRINSEKVLRKVWFSGEKRFTIEKPDHVKIGSDADKSSDKQIRKRKSSNSSNDEEEEDQDIDECDESEDQITTNKIPIPNSGKAQSFTQLMTANSSDTNADVIDMINYGTNYCNNSTGYLPDDSCYSMASSSSSNFCSTQNSNAQNYSNTSTNYAGSNTLNYDASTVNYQQSRCSETVETYLPSAQSQTELGEEQNVVLPSSCRSTNSVIVSIAVSLGGKTDPVFIDGSFGNISSDCYRKEVLSTVLPHIKKKSSDFIFVQDRAPAHRSQNTVRYLQQHCPEFIKPEEWPANCPQLNPVDYFVWKKLQSMVYCGESIKSINELKERILKCWHNVSQKSINTAIMQFRNKLKSTIHKAEN
ncbi:hypothetical protein CHUAL_014079 [Chamberlinius hualienensis]